MRYAFKVCSTGTRVADPTGHRFLNDGLIEFYGVFVAFV
jgi:hypothetical protein